VKTLQIDDKFSIVYDDENNDRPQYVERHGSRHSNLDMDMPNWIIAMFYALLEHQQNVDLVNEANMQIESLKQDADSWDNSWAEGDI